MNYLSRASSDLLMTINTALNSIIQFNMEEERWVIEFEEDSESVEAIARLLEMCREDEVKLAQVLCVMLSYLGTWFIEVAEYEEVDPKDVLTDMSLDILSKGSADVGGD